MANYKFKPALTEVKMIRKERLSEREFYHRIMEAIYRLGDTELLSEEETKEFQDALRKQGCVDYAEYQKQEEAKGNPTPPDWLNEEIYRGDLCVAAAFISQILSSVDNARYFIPRVNEGYQEAYTYQWLQASRRKINVNEYYKRKSEDLDAFQKLPGDEDEEPCL